MNCKDSEFRNKLIYLSNVVTAYRMGMWVECLLRCRDFVANKGCLSFDGRSAYVTGSKTGNNTLGVI